MIELVVPDTLERDDHLEDDRLSLARTMVGRRVFAFEGTLEEAREIAAELSGESREPVLVNDVRDRGGEARIVDVYMHRAGRQLSVSKNVRRPSPK